MVTSLGDVEREMSRPLRMLADQAFSRAAGSLLIPGNRIRLLKDGEQNYPAWIEAIQNAKSTVYFESYLIHSDRVGRQFADLLISKAREGLRVRVIYDWMGALRRASPFFWRRLARAGVKVRCFNPPKLDSPLGWLSRDHRKMITVDGRLAYVTGLCIGERWLGDPDRKIEPWRDTGVEIEGPAVADIQRAFSQTWALTGPLLPAAELDGLSRVQPAKGDTALRVIATEPSTAGLYRLDQLIAALARQSIWLTDAYFLGTTPYVQALRAAALDGVDVRLLVPRTTDVPVLRTVSRAGYRGLLEAGVRIFEWDGPMLHAKTAVTDGRWARVGSTNLNLASWIGNWELDVVAEDEAFSKAMEALYLDDLQHATEIVLHERRKVRRAASESVPRARGGTHGPTGWAAKGVLRIGNTLGAAFTNHRVLGPAEASLMFAGSLLLFGLAITATLLPRALATAIALLATWLGLALLVKALRLRFSRRTKRRGVEEDLPLSPGEVAPEVTAIRSDKTTEG